MLKLSLWAKSLSRVRLFATPWTVARQAPLSMGILQARILEWVAMPSFRGSSQPRDWTQVYQIAGGFLTVWTTKEAHFSLVTLKRLAYELVDGRGYESQRLFYHKVHEAKTLECLVVIVLFSKPHVHLQGLGEEEEALATHKSHDLLLLTGNFGGKNTILII